jgi:hypothetical protein
MLLRVLLALFVLAIVVGAPALAIGLVVDGITHHRPGSLVLGGVAVSLIVALTVTTVRRRRGPR